ncbi:cellulose-binding domain-containing protein [Streptomyces sp. NBC_00820]|uniref:cellulose-binding domain-containing protein n=1 Tax=Streptomyces sp. NBC_00820 TaxID=2975842 RepID=UPI002ED2AAAB|nr:cellulose-binding domain-containing protein [Streptomyces sp. NBC_00820]
MPDLPTPQDATEATLFSECWDAVLSYADLCTAGSQKAPQLANEAFTLGMRELRAAGAPGHGTVRPAARLPVIAELLTAVRDTAAAWETGGQGHRLDPELRLWLNSGNAARYAGPPLQRPVALRGLRDMQDTDASLLWLAEVEALPLPTVARRLGLDTGTVADELDQVRVLFRDRCHRAHLDSPMDAQCRSYARLLDAVTRSPSADTPEDLSRHLATCVRCAEAAACLRLHGGALPAALAGGVIGWGGLAYLERRRRATEVRLGVGRPSAAGTGDLEEGTGRSRVLRNGLLAAAVLLSALALGVSLMPFGDSTGGSAAAHDDRQPVADPAGSRTAREPAPSSAPSAAASEHTAPVTDSPSATAARSGTRRRSLAPSPPGTSQATPAAPRTTPPATTTCEVAYDVVDQWADGFQATVTFTAGTALTDWHVDWTYRDGQRVSQMWDARAHQNGSHVTASATGYNKDVTAHSPVTFGFVGSSQGENPAPSAFTLNGAPCAAG